MKKTKIIIPALGMLLLSTAASVSGTVAWFSMNNTVSVTGMTVKTKVSSNLQIADTNAEANYTDSIEQAREGTLEPASAVEALTYYYTNKAKGDGSATAQGTDGNNTFKPYSEATNELGTNDKAKTGKTYYDQTFNSDYGFSYDATDDDGAVCFAYIDYTFYLKATTSKLGQYIAMTKCNLLYGHPADSNNNIAVSWSALGSGDYAWRVGVFAQAVNANAEGSAMTSSNLVSTLRLNGAIYQSQSIQSHDNLEAGASLAGYYTDAACTTPAAADAVAVANTTYYSISGNAQAVSGTDDNAKTNVTTLDQAAQISSAAVAVGTSNGSPEVGQTYRYKVVVRLWLEGEDKSCTSDTYVALTENWKLDLDFALTTGEGTVAEPAAVTNIGSVAA